MTLWHGRIDGEMSATLWELSESYSFDVALWRHDIAASRAHVRGLVRAGILSEEEADRLVEVLDAIGDEFAAGTFVRAGSDEDVHTAIERRATELAGALGARLHTARSRNDQVATALRLWCRDAVAETAEAVIGLMRSLDGLAERYPAASLPGYTHLQRAQPVLLSHHLRAHCFALARDVERLVETARRLNVSPLGAGALAGTSLPIDPTTTARELGFARAFDNSLDAVSDRDFVAEALFDLALLGVHLSRMGEELVLWTTSEFGFARLADEFTTGSSMLPHKRNSDVAELARGKAGRLIGHLSGLLATLKGLPLSYNRDLQEDKEPLFDAVRQARLVVAALSGAYAGLEFDVAAGATAADDPLVVAIDLAEWLVERGTPFRQAHERVASLVRRSVDEGHRLVDLVTAEADLAGAAALFEPGAALIRRRSPGAAGPVAAVAERVSLGHLIERLDGDVAGIART